LDEIVWNETGSEVRYFSESELRKIAEVALGSLPNPTAKPGKISLKGLLGKKGEEHSLVLEARIELNELSEPIEAAVAATGRVRGAREASVLVRKGLEDLAWAAKNLINLTNADAGRLIKALSSAEPDEQILALKLLGTRQAQEAVQAIGRLLGDPRFQVAETAAEALAEIGDERAVPLLIASIQHNDLRSEVRAIEAMGVIGGKEAEAYLEMTANGHEIPEVRSLSKSLLKQLRAY
jgi:hypothetical protein